MAVRLVQYHKQACDLKLLDGIIEHDAGYRNGSRVVARCIYRRSPSSRQPRCRMWCLYTVLRDPDCTQQTFTVRLQHEIPQICRLEHLQLFSGLALPIRHPSTAHRKCLSMSERDVGTEQSIPVTKISESNICGAGKQKQTTKQGHATE